MGAPYQMEIAYKGGTILSSDQAQLEDALMKENESKYRLAYSSSFMHPPLFSDFGQMALNSTALKVLDGSYICNPQVSKYIKQFIKYLKMDKCVKKQGFNDIQISTEQSNNFWKLMKEKNIFISLPQTYWHV